jgi:hypothetical protein
MADTTVDANVNSFLHTRTQRLGPVWTDENTAYVFYIDASDDVVFNKTSDGGASWAGKTVIKTGTCRWVSVWYDKWTTGDVGTTIHVAYLDTGSHDIFYRDLDTSDDSLGTEITVFSGVSFEFEILDITKARGGNLYCGFWGDNDGENGFYRSTDSGANWTSRAQLADGNATDFILLMPGNEADNQDIWCIYWDASADELSLKIYDNSDGASGSWSETLISGSMVDSPTYYQMSAAPRHSDNHVILAAWSELDAATADLKVWDIGGSADITAKTDVVTDLDESAQVAVFINQQTSPPEIYVAYLKGGTWTATVDVKYKKSTDGGAAWGSEQTYSEAAADNLGAVWAGISVGDAGGKFQPCWFNDDLNDLFVNLVNDVDIAAADGAPTTRRYSLTVTGVG